jgi:hypothetical protein
MDEDNNLGNSSIQTPLADDNVKSTKSQPEVVAKLTKAQFAHALELKFRKSAARTALDDTIAAVHRSYEMRAYMLEREESDFWAGLRDAFGLREDHVYSIDEDTQNIVMFPRTESA